MNGNGEEERSWNGRITGGVYHKSEDGRQKIITEKIDLTGNARCAFVIGNEHHSTDIISLKVIFDENNVPHVKVTVSEDIDLEINH